MLRADDLPTFTTAFNPVVSDNNPLGVKRVGEVPTTGSPPAVVNAVLEALRRRGVHAIDMPLTPSAWRALGGRAERRRHGRLGGRPDRRHSASTPRGLTSTEGGTEVTLLEPDEPQPVQVERADSPSPFLFACDHAGRRVPRALGDLGLAAAHFERHIAYDVGIEPVARRLAAAFDAPLVAQTYSRLVIDCNRPTHVPASIPTVSEATPIPGNEGISQAQRDARIDALFRPYHDTLEGILETRKAEGVPTVVIAMHSFTPVYNGASRPWRLGLLYNRDARLAGALLRILNDDAAPYIGDKLPYAVDDETDYTLPVHGEQRGLLHVGFEIRQDLISDRSGQSAWADWLELLLRRLLLERLAPEFGG